MHCQSIIPNNYRHYNLPIVIVLANFIKKLSEIVIMQLSLWHGKKVLTWIGYKDQIDISRHCGHLIAQISATFPSFSTCNLRTLSLNELHHNIIVPSVTVQGIFTSLHMHMRVTSAKLRLNLSFRTFSEISKKFNCVPII